MPTFTCSLEAFNMQRVKNQWEPRSWDCFMKDHSGQVRIEILILRSAITQKIDTMGQNQTDTTCISPILAHYPRPVLAFLHCRCLCLRVRPYVNYNLVHAIARILFKLESPNLDQKRKTPWLRSLLFRVANVLDHQVKFNFKIRFYPNVSLNFFLCDNSSSVQARITKFGPEVQNNLVKILLFWRVIPRLLHNPDCLKVSTLCTYTDLSNHG